MKTLLTFITLLSICFYGCDPGGPMDGKLSLKFQPAQNSRVKMNYDFMINSPTTGNKTAFKIELSGIAAFATNGEIVLRLKNDHISMDGIVEGKPVSLVAGNDDSISTELKMVIGSVFSLLNKEFVSTYDVKLNKTSEVVLNDSTGTDKSENRMQFFLRYPDSAVKVGDTWQKELIIKSGNKMNCSATYTLKELQDSIAVISITGILSGEGETFGHAFSIDGKLNGTFRVDLVSGWPLRTEVNQDFTLSVQEKKILMQYEIRHSVTLE